MAERKISGNVRIGGIYECDFGSYKAKNGGVTVLRDEAVCDDLNYRIPNEMIKRRPVVVVSKHRGVCTVVPISTTKEKQPKNPKKDLIENGICIDFKGLIPKTHFYDPETPCWAVCYAVQMIDIGRLRDIYDQDEQKHLTVSISAEMVRNVRFGIVKAIGLPSLVHNAPESTNFADEVVETEIA